MLKPQCMPYYYDEQGNKIEKQVTQGIAYTTDGFLLPCCWCDAPHTRKDFEELGMHDEKLKLSNNGCVEDIIRSEEWQNMIEIIVNCQEQAPAACKKHCGAS